MRAQEAEPIPESELPAFLGGAPHHDIRWTVVNNIDFAVYYGKANPPLNGSLGFYVGAFPQDMTPRQTVVQSRVGRYRAKWQRTINTDGSIHQEAIVVLGGPLNMKSHIWVRAPNAQDLEKLLAVVDQLSMFSSGVLPARFQEVERLAREEQRVRDGVWVGWCTIILLSAWLAKRICPLRPISAALRLLIFAAIITFWISAFVAVAPFLTPVAIDWFHLVNGWLLLAAAAGLVVVAVSVAGGMLLVRLFYTPKSPTASAQ